MRFSTPVMVMLAFTAVCSLSSAEDFAAYIRESRDFEAVKKPEPGPGDRWDRWVFMPWKHRWGGPYDEDLAAAMKKAGFNGGVCENAGLIDSCAPLHEKHGFLWYLGHTAGKGDLFLRENDLPADEKKELRRKGTRPRCLLDPDVIARMKKENIEPAVSSARGFETCAAYALDDEISWGFFTTPVRWDNSKRSIAGFNEWLDARYGSKEALLAQWGTKNEKFMGRMATPDDFQQLYRSPLHEWNLSPWCDALSYMDSQLLNLVGELVEHANALDPERPCGFVGCQGPAAYGGTNYAKVIRKVQFLEAYDIGCSMEILRSFNRSARIPLVQTCFLDPRSPQGRWFLWNGMVHGNRGVIQWAEDWWKEGGDMLSIGPVLRQIEKQSRKLHNAKWMHDKVALYYSHPSIQVSWFIDCELHQRTWINRQSGMNNRLSSVSGTFWAWTKLLEDAGLQYDFVSYADLLENGLDEITYKVLILPRTLALSAQEARLIEEYVKRGGVVIADHMTGIFDQHGRGWKRPALDELFGIGSRPRATRDTMFGGSCLAELDPETYYKKTFIEAGREIRAKCKRSKGMAVAERELRCFREKKTGKGWAVHMNTSVMEYVGLRAEGDTAAEYAAPIIELLHGAEVKPRMKLLVNRERPSFTEVLCWKNNGRVYAAVIRNPNPFAVANGRAKEFGIGPEQVKLLIRFESAKEDVIDELTGKRLGTGVSFELPWKTDGVVLLSFRLGN